jgi:NAD(P)-dependent dehydrogenase (short-subunit alcohol dehydrogenase family)
MPIKPQRGAIVNIASITAVTGMGFAAYAPTKHGVIGITQNGAFFYSPHGIRCNSIAPRGTLTPMMLASMPQDLKGQGYQSEDSQICRPIAIRTISCPEEQANVISFLLSSESSHVTAVNIMVDGGFAFTRS